MTNEAKTTKPLWNGPCLTGKWGNTIAAVDELKHLAQEVADEYAAADLCHDFGNLTWEQLDVIHRGANGSKRNLKGTRAVIAEAIAENTRLEEEWRKEEARERKAKRAAKKAAKQ